MAVRMAEQPAEHSRFPDGFRILNGKQEYITYVEHSSIRIWPSDVAAHYENHQHSAVEIILPDRGVTEYQLPDCQYRVEPGEVLIIPSGCPHALTETGKTLRYLLLFEPNPLLSLRDIPMISGMMQQPVYLKEPSPVLSQVRQLLMQAVNCYFERKPLWNTQCYSYLLQMYALLGERYLKLTESTDRDGVRTIDPEIMNSAITYINQHYMDEIDLKTVADFAGFSKYYFSRTFKQFAGVPFTEFLCRKRLEVATDLLVRTRRSVREIAEQSGFGSIATFNRIFREHKNCTPTQYRAIYGTLVPQSTGVPFA